MMCDVSLLSGRQRDVRLWIVVLVISRHDTIPKHKLTDGGYG